MTATLTCDAPACSTTYDPLDPRTESYTVTRSFLGQQTFDTCSVACLARLANSWSSIRTDSIDRESTPPDTLHAIDQLTWAKTIVGLAAGNDPSTAAYQSIIDGEGVIVDVEQLVDVRDTLGALIAELDEDGGGDDVES